MMALARMAPPWAVAQPVVVKKLTIGVHRVQSEFCRSTAIFRAFMGGRGAGKSWIGAYDLLRRAKPGRTYLVASSTACKMADETFPTLKDIAQKLGLWNPHTMRMSPYPTVRLTTGATIRLRSADKPDTLRGPNLSGVWLDEGSLMDEAVFKIVIGCLHEIDFCLESGHIIRDPSNDYGKELTKS